MVDSFNVQMKYTFNAITGFHFAQKPQREHNQLFWKVVWVVLTQSHQQHEARPLFQWAHEGCHKLLWPPGSKCSLICHFGIK